VLRLLGQAATSSLPKIMLLLLLLLKVYQCKFDITKLAAFISDIFLALRGKERPKRSTTGASSNNSLLSRITRSSTSSSMTVVT